MFFRDAAYGVQSHRQHSVPSVLGGFKRESTHDVGGGVVVERQGGFDQNRYMYYEILKNKKEL